MYTQNFTRNRFGLVLLPWNIYTYKKGEYQEIIHKEKKGANNKMIIVTICPDSHVSATHTTQYYDPALKRWSSRGMYIRSLYLKRLSGNQRGETGLLVTCVSHHMTDMQLSNDVRKHLVEINDVRIGDAFDLINCELKITVVGATVETARAIAVCFVRVKYYLKFVCSKRN